MIGHGGKNLKLWFKILTKIHNRCHISTSVAVIRGGPDGDYILVFKVVFVAFVDELVGAGYELETVYVVELVFVN